MANEDIHRDNLIDTLGVLKLVGELIPEAAIYCSLSCRRTDDRNQDEPAKDCQDPTNNDSRPGETFILCRPEDFIFAIATWPRIAPKKERRPKVNNPTTIDVIIEVMAKPFARPRAISS